MATSTSNNSNININNLNIITFIKDIYLSLKHIDTCFSTFKNDIDSKIIKLEIQYETILERLSQIEQSIGQVNERLNQSSNIDSTLEKELLDKMYKLSCATENANHLELKPKELTIANILENGYTMLDINNSLETNMDSNEIFAEPIPSDTNDSMAFEISATNSEKKQTLDSLLFD
jgi:DNA-binding transcriptional MerR regulator